MERKRSVGFLLRPIICSIASPAPQNMDVYFAFEQRSLMMARAASILPMTIRRMKTYTGGQGYVYQYYFVGQRPAVEPGAPATEYIFDVTSDRKTTYAVSVLFELNALQSWTRAHGRTPSEAEEYGAAKLRLFQAFDEIEDMMAAGRQL